MLTNNVAKLDVGTGQYTFLLNEDGGVIDDLIVYRIDEQKFLLVVNAAEPMKISPGWKHIFRRKMRVSDSVNRSADFGGVAIQGPRVVDLFHALFGEDVELPARNTLSIFRSTEQPSRSRGPVTPAKMASKFSFARPMQRSFGMPRWKAARPFGTKPCGLGARDTLRLEMCYPLNGSDLSPERNPIEAGLGFFVDLTKPKFTGRDTLLETKESGPRERLVSFRMNGKGPPPRPHYALFRTETRSAK